MTLADKKIEEFINKFSKKRNFAGNNSYHFVNYRTNILENWLRKALAEVEIKLLKEVIAKITITNLQLKKIQEFPNQSKLDFVYRFCEKKLKELEAGKCK